MKVPLSILFLIASVAASSDDECPPEQEHDWTIEKLLAHEDCNKFYKCTYGQPVEMVCYGNLWFNLETWQCDWPYNVDCTGRIIPTTTQEPTTITTTVAPNTTTTTTTTTTQAPNTTTTTTTTTTLAPNTTTTTTTTPAPNTTTTTTTTPAPTTTTTTTTLAPNTTTTSTTTLAPNTTTTTTTTPAPNTTTTTTTTTTQAPNTTTTTTTLAPNTTTTTTTTTTTPEPTTTSTSTTVAEIEFLPNGCPADPHIHWLLPHEEDCNLFYYCVWGEKVLRQCPSTLHFNREIQVCDYPYRAGCTAAFNKHLNSRLALLASK